MCKKLNFSEFDNENVKNINIGNFSKEVIEFIIDKKPEFLGRVNIETDILFWKARVKHTNNHKKDFVSEQEFLKCVEDIPQIIQTPDYISVHPTDESVSFIKQYTEKVSVAIKISTDGKLCYRTMYPLDESQLLDYISKGRAWKYN